MADGVKPLYMLDTACSGQTLGGFGSKLPEFAEGFRQFKNNFAVPALFLHNFPSWFAGVAFAAIGIGALVPAAIMCSRATSIANSSIHVPPTSRKHRWPNGYR